MKTELQWTEKDGDWIAEANGFQFIIRHNPFTGWVSKIKKPTAFPIPRILLEDAKEECQSHHDAICKAVEEEAKSNYVRREFNSVGHAELPSKAAPLEIAKWLRDKAIWEQLQPEGRGMDARE